MRFALSRLARYCTAEHLAPADVNDEVLARFLAHMDSDGLVRKPRRVHRAACVAWNRAVATLPSWPQQIVAVPDYRDRYVVSWTAFPPSLKADVDAYLDHLAGKDILAEADFRPLRPASLRSRERLLKEYLSGLVRQGHDPQTIRSLADVVDVATVRKGLEFFLDRGNGNLKRQPHDVAYAVKAVARHWVKVPPAHLEQLKAFCRRLKPNYHGLTDRNRNRLRPFDDPKNVHALLNLPMRILQDLPKRGPRLQRHAVAVQTAVAIELLLMVPIRISNLASLELGRHLIRTRGGKSLHLAIPGTEVKNGVDIEAELPSSTVALIDLYLTQYRSALLNIPSTALFPRRNGLSKSDQPIRKQIATTVRKFCGLDVNPHLFRHIAAKIYLDKHPGAYGVVRLLHGHRSVNTTTAHYCGMEQPAAFRHFDDHVLKVRGETQTGRRRG